MRRLPTRDIIATGAVLAAVVLYLLWLADAALLGLSGTRATGLVVVGLGFAASASAVVPGFDQLLHGNKVYLGVTTLLGLAALAAAVIMLWSASSTALAALMLALVVLWLISTAHHVLLARVDRSAAPADDTEPPRDRRHHAGVR